MIDAGISPGDLVLVRKQSEAMDGDIVVALVANENTLKRYFVDKENQKIRLHPENKTMKDIIVSDCKIKGAPLDYRLRTLFLCLYFELITKPHREQLSTLFRRSILW